MARDDDDTDIDDYLRTAPQAFLVCRAIGHAWDPTHDGWLRPNGDEPWRIILHCLRCGGEGEIYPDQLGGKFSRTSTMDPSYYVKGTRLSRNDVRWFLLQQSQDAAKTNGRPRGRRKK